ncbi:branched-chain amino acid ABC transporter permease [Nonomuraea typhae]|uniref:branched-chain amino acid ABC transporter permease n=1 Tax=Nonomuraea typhae TaxID=2603600 RepID=UPI0015E1E32D|nr:branched-chain amino acid ABC transporter permease [Nonomuraea typhae]
MTLLLQGLVLGVLTGGLYALLASGLSLYFGVMRVVMVAHPAFLFLAAYLTYTLHTTFGLDPLLTIPFTVPVFFALGVLVQRLLIARLAADQVQMMSVLLTFGLALAIEGLLGAIYTGSYKSVTVGYDTRSLTLGSVSLPYDKIIAFGVAGLTLGVLFGVLVKSRFGQALRATIQHREAARLVGIRTDRVTGYGFGVGLATAAVGGGVLALITPFFPASHWAWIGKLMAIIVVGGLGSVVGAALAAVLLGVVEGLVLVTVDATWATLMFYAFLFVTLLLRPQGFFGGRLAHRF